MPPKNNLDFCPYQDKQCPKISDLEKDIKFLRKTVFDNQKILYIIIGMIAIEWGVMIF